MKIEFTTEQLGTLHAAMICLGVSKDNELCDKILEAYTQSLELDDMDFDDCEGGACKL